MMDWGKFLNDLKIFKIVFRVKNKNSYKSLFFELYYIDQFEIIISFFFCKNITILQSIFVEILVKNF